MSMLAAGSHRSTDLRPAFEIQVWPAQLSSMPGEMPFCENKLKENMLCQTLSSMPGGMPFCQNKLKENMLCQTLSSMPGEILFR